MLLQTRLAIRNAANQILKRTDFNNTAHTNPLVQKSLRTGMDTVIEGVSATGIPVISQIAGVAGVMSGIFKLADAGARLFATALSAATAATQDYGFGKTALSALKSIGLGISTFFPVVGIPVNVASVAISAANASLYYFVEPMTQAKETDINELLEKILAYKGSYKDEEKTHELEFLLAKIGPAIIPHAIRILKDDQAPYHLQKSVIRAAGLMDRFNNNSTDLSVLIPAMFEYAPHDRDYPKPSVQFLERIDTGILLPHLFAALENKDFKVRDVALQIMDSPWRWNNVTLRRTAIQKLKEIADQILSVTDDPELSEFRAKTQRLLVKIQEFPFLD